MWQSPDPILEEYMSGKTNGGVFNPKNLSLFSYTANNPVNLVDPDGMAPVDLDIVFNDILGGEGFKSYMYLDTAKPKSLVTVGYGKMIPSSNAATKLPFKLDGKAADTKTIKSAWNQVYNSVKGVNKYKASYFKDMTKIRITADDAKDIALTHIKGVANNARQAFTGFDDMPEEAQRAVLDMGYNLGISENGITHFPSFSKHIRNGDFASAAKESNRPQLSSERNEHVYNLLMQAHQIESQKPETQK